MHKVCAPALAAVLLATPATALADDTPTPRTQRDQLYARCVAERGTDHRDACQDYADPGWQHTRGTPTYSPPNRSAPRKPAPGPRRPAPEDIDQ